MKTRKIFSFDAETDGLYGKPFSIAAIVYENGKEVDKTILRLPDSVVSNQWVKENVLPAISDIEVTHAEAEYEKMILEFSEFYMKHREGAEIICHMGYIVEAFLIREMYRLGGIGEIEGPYPLYDVSGNLQAENEDPTSVDSYAKKHNIKLNNNYGSTHNPLYDCEVAAKVYMYLTQ